MVVAPTRMSFAITMLVGALAVPRGGPASMPASTPARSTALPFLPRPATLDGCLVGDVGFDPLGLSTAGTLPRLREAEVRHGRLAMMATWGWPVANLGFGLATRLVPPGAICTGNGCEVDGPLGASALSLEAIRSASFAYWGALLMMTAGGELLARARRAAGDERGSFDPLALAESASADERRRLQLAEIKHGRLAMCSLAFFWVRKWATEPSYTFAHQLWGQTCVFNLKAACAGFCYTQSVPYFDFVLSWEIMFRVITGYFAEPYF